MGIDYGSKRVGIAISDERNEFAMPKAVYPNDERLLQTVLDFVAHNDVGKIVMGESTDFQGRENKIMREVHEFKKNLERESGKSVFLEPEFFTSQEAERTGNRRPDHHAGERPSRGETKNEMLDASAAALILKSFMDKKKNDQF